MSEVRMLSDIDIVIYKKPLGTNWFTWTKGNEGISRAGWSPRPHRFTWTSRINGTKGNHQSIPVRNEAASYRNSTICDLVLLWRAESTHAKFQ